MNNLKIIKTFHLFLKMKTNQMHNKENFILKSWIKYILTIYPMFYIVAKIKNKKMMQLMGIMSSFDINNPMNRRIITIISKG